ncbi:MAG TPA: ribosome biogenesis GTPase Der [bacterium]|nr:ribosome biogenesis GTPase Der [bacterium]
MKTETPPLVSIVGRPNVGKSTLFNRLLGRRVSIVDDMAGVTRDRIFARCGFGGVPAFLVDTGGLTPGGKSELDRNIEKQILMSFESSAVLVFVADAAAGVMPEDRIVADVLRKHNKPVILAANKSDSGKIAQGASEFFALGMGEPIAVSALHGDNIEALRERVAALLPKARGASFETPETRFCVVGRPNVGKSSIVNAVLGEERCVVSDVPGTTRDKVDAEFVHDGRRFVIVDTAGLKRRKSKMDRLEFYSSTRTRRAMAESDVVALVLDSRDGLLEGDKRIINEAIDLKRGLVIVCNKMDLVDNPDYDNFLHHIKTEAPFLMHTPVLFVSARERAGMEALLDRLSEVSARMRFMLPLELLTNVVYDVRSMYSPGSRGRKMGEIRGVVHDSANPPRIIIKVNDPELFPQAYVKLVENRIRGVFDLVGVPLDLKLSGAPVKKKK